MKGLKQKLLGLVDTNPAPPAMFTTEIDCQFFWRHVVSAPVNCRGTWPKPLLIVLALQNPRHHDSLHVPIPMNSAIGEVQLAPKALNSALSLDRTENAYSRAWILVYHLDPITSVSFSSHCSLDKWKETSRAFGGQDWSGAIRNDAVGFEQQRTDAMIQSNYILCIHNWLLP